MKLTTEEVEAKMAAAWGRQAHVVCHRICGNRLTYVVTDHQEHWQPLLRTWESGRAVFEPVAARWPEDPWAEAILEAVELARAYFAREGNGLALRRLPRAQAIALMRRWVRLGDELDTYVIPSASTSGVVYQVNGCCTCPDWLKGSVPGGWCKHRIARALAKRATAILENGKGTEGDSSTPVPDSGPGGTDTQDTISSDNGQPQRIELRVGYEASEAFNLPHVNANGKLISFKADGEKTAPPVKTMPELYRWLQAEGYVPAEFKWLQWEGGLRHRKQTYILDGNRSLAEKVGHGLSKLLKAVR